MGRNFSNKPKCDHTMSVSKEAYDVTTKLKNLMPNNASYDDIQRELTKCYILHHKISLNGGSPDGRQV